MQHGVSSNSKSNLARQISSVTVAYLAVAVAAIVVVVVAAAAVAVCSTKQAFFSTKLFVVADVIQLFTAIWSLSMMNKNKA